MKTTHHPLEVLDPGNTQVANGEHENGEYENGEHLPASYAALKLKPAKVSVGLSKKVDLPKGSLDATCHVELELDGSLFANDPDKFQEHVRRAFQACVLAVNDELVRKQGAGTARGGSRRAGRRSMLMSSQIDDKEDRELDEDDAACRGSKAPGPHRPLHSRPAPP